LNLGEKNMKSDLFHLVFNTSQRTGPKGDWRGDKGYNYKRGNKRVVGGVDDMGQRLPKWGMVKERMGKLVLEKEVPRIAATRNGIFAMWEELSKNKEKGRKNWTEKLTGQKGVQSAKGTTWLFEEDQQPREL